MWNCREFGNQVTERERELGDYTRAKDPSVMFIAETWTKHRLKFDHMSNVPRINRGGGLVLFWKDSMNLRVEHLQKIILTAL